MKKELFSNFVGLLISLTIVFGPIFVACYAVCFLNLEEASPLEVLGKLAYFLGSFAWGIVVGCKYMLDIMDAIASWLMNLCPSKVAM